MNDQDILKLNAKSDYFSFIFYLMLSKYQVRAYNIFDKFNVYKYNQISTDLI